MNGNPAELALFRVKLALRHDTWSEREVFVALRDSLDNIAELHRACAIAASEHLGDGDQRRGVLGRVTASEVVGCVLIPREEVCTEFLRVRQACEREPFDQLLAVAERATKNMNFQGQVKDRADLEAAIARVREAMEVQGA